MEPTLSPILSRHLQALDRDPPATALDTAQARLERRLAGTGKASPRPGRWIGALAAGTVCLLLVLVLVPTSRGIAFDAVIKHLRDFQTLDMQITQRSQGVVLPTLHVRMDRTGNARTDFGEATSVIVNAHERRILTLLHEPRLAMVTVLPPGPPPRPEDALKWLDAIRQFQGEADALPGQRVIDGRVTHGWRLQARGMRIEIWADADALPLAVEIGDGKMLSQRIHVTVDPPLGANVFATALPAGYTEAQPDQD